MNRRAILISASSEANPIPGVHADIASWNSFLRSKFGGNWTHQEIFVAEECDREQLVAAVQSAKGAEYALVVFAGVGKMVETDLPWTEAQLLLSDGSLVLERDLNPGTPRCMLVLDCCQRSLEPGKALGADEKANRPQQEQDSAIYRELYEQYLGAAESGLVKIYTIATATSAEPSPSFSQRILHLASAWVKENRGVLSIEEGVLLLTESTDKINVPEYHGGRRRRHFPLAVNI